VCLVSTVRLTGAFFGVDGAISYHGAYWLIPVLAFWGVGMLGCLLLLRR
jgi:hypothetical protein